MYQYKWDEETGGLILTNELSKFSKEPRPVYYQELDLLGFDKFWKYPQNDSAPIMWAEAGNYIYRGRNVAKVSGGSLFQAPEIHILDKTLSKETELEFVELEGMVSKNKDKINSLEGEAIQLVYNTFREYKEKIDVFYVAFSGGKDSIVALNIVQKSLGSDDFIVVFGNTHMELPDTWKSSDTKNASYIELVKNKCEKNKIRFIEATSHMLPDCTWQLFGPPSITNRWCCSIHKTVPQILFLRNYTNKPNFTGLAFTGIRADESSKRSTYDKINDGRKHNGQMSVHPLLDWSSAEVFLYIYTQKLPINEAYKKGNLRVGCLLCPESSEKHDFVKYYNYQKSIDPLLNIIVRTSNRQFNTPKKIQQFIEQGQWKTRKTGQVLNFGYDKFEISKNDSLREIKIFSPNFKWQQWAKTIGSIDSTRSNRFSISFRDKTYYVSETHKDTNTILTLENCDNSKQDIRFFFLMKSVVIKSLYCVGCRECEVECKNGSIHMDSKIDITDNCIHCHKCHNIRDHCLRYSSIRNKRIKMTGLDRYYSFGFRAKWLEIFVKYEGKSKFWETDGDYQVPNKKKDAFKNFLEDSGLILCEKSTKQSDKYSKCIPTLFAQKVISLGAYNPVTWALILNNLTYAPTYGWLVRNLRFGEIYTVDSLKLLLSNVMETDVKGEGRRNVVDSLKNVTYYTPLGQKKIFTEGTFEVKKRGESENISLTSLTRSTWESPEPRVILYSLYKFSEHCDGCYQFSLTTLLDDEIERAGVSPTRIFGLTREVMIPLLNGLTVNYPDFISASFTLGLETITLNADKTSNDVLSLF